MEERDFTTDRSIWSWELVGFLCAVGTIGFGVMAAVTDLGRFAGLLCFLCLTIFVGVELRRMVKLGRYEVIVVVVASLAALGLLMLSFIDHLEPHDPAWLRAGAGGCLAEVAGVCWYKRRKDRRATS